MPAAEGACAQRTARGITAQRRTRGLGWRRSRPVRDAAGGASRRGARAEGAAVRGLPRSLAARDGAPAPDIDRVVADHPRRRRPEGRTVRSCLRRCHREPHRRIVGPHAGSPAPAGRAAEGTTHGPARSRRHRWRHRRTRHRVPVHRTASRTLGRRDREGADRGRPPDRAELGRAALGDLLQAGNAARHQRARGPSRDGGVLSRTGAALRDLRQGDRRRHGRARCRRLRAHLRTGPAERRPVRADRPRTAARSGTRGGGRAGDPRARGRDRELPRRVRAPGRDHQRARRAGHAEFPGRRHDVAARWRDRPHPARRGERAARRELRRAVFGSAREAGRAGRAGAHRAVPRRVLRAGARQRSTCAGTWSTRCRIRTSRFSACTSPG